MASTAIPRLTAGAPIRGATRTIHVTVNDVPFDIAVQDRTLLVHFLRDILGMRPGPTSAVIRPIAEPARSCSTMAGQVVHGPRRPGRWLQVRTVEGLEVGGKLSAVQDGFTTEHGLQCGFCTPGMMMTSTALLAKNPNPSGGGDSPGNLR